MHPKHGCFAQTVSKSELGGLGYDGRFMPDLISAEGNLQHRTPSLISATDPLSTASHGARGAASSQVANESSL